MSEFPQWLNPRPIESWPRALTANRARAPFSAAWGSTTELLKAELRHLGTRTSPAPIVMQIAITEDDVRLDGRLRTTANPKHPGVILAIESRHGNLAYPCDKFTRWQDNVRAIALALESLRRVDRYGITETGQQYTGWKAIETTRAADSTIDAAEDLIRSYTDDYTIPLHAALRNAKRESHPDRNNGDRAQWNGVEVAEQTLRKAGRI